MRFASCGRRVAASYLSAPAPPTGPDQDRHRDQGERPEAAPGRPGSEGAAAVVLEVVARGGVALVALTVLVRVFLVRVVLERTVVGSIGHAVAVVVVVTGVAVVVVVRVFLVVV